MIQGRTAPEPFPAVCRCGGQRSYYDEEKRHIMHFKRLTLSEIPLVQPYFRQMKSRTCDFTVGGMFMWRNYYKMEYAMEQNDKGKMQPVKIGLAPVQREDTEYEFDVVLNISRDHTAFPSKDTTFLDTWTGIITPELGKSLKDWMDNGVEPARCSACGRLVKPGTKFTVEQIVAMSEKSYGKPLCLECYAKEYRRRREASEHAASTISGTAGAAGA